MIEENCEFPFYQNIFMHFDTNKWFWCLHHLIHHSSIYRCKNLFYWPHIKDTEMWKGQLYACMFHCDNIFTPICGIIFMIIFIRMAMYIVSYRSFMRSSVIRCLCRYFYECYDIHFKLVTERLSMG